MSTSISKLFRLSGHGPDKALEELTHVVDGVAEHGEDLNTAIQELSDLLAHGDTPDMTALLEHLTEFLELYQKVKFLLPRMEKAVLNLLNNHIAINTGAYEETEENSQAGTIADQSS